MDRTPDNERSNPISRAFSKLFERGKVGDRKTQATPRAGMPTHAATRQSAPQPRAVPQATATAASTTARAAQPATAGLQTAASASAARPATPTATPTASATIAPKPRTHTVERGDTLSGIAREVYGRADRWNLIYQANRDKIDDPDRIYPGQVLVIPDAPSVH